MSDRDLAELLGSPAAASRTRLVEQVPTTAAAGPREVRESSRWRWVLPIGGSLVSPGATMVFTTQPQCTFGPRRLSIASDVAESFTIHDIRVGRNSQLLTSQGFSCKHFPPLPFALEGEELAKWEEQLTWKLDTVQIGQSLIFTVENTGPAPKIFEALYWGHMVE